MFEIIGQNRNLTADEINASFLAVEESLRALPQGLAVEDILDLLPVIKYLSLTNNDDLTSEEKTDRTVNMLHSLGQWVHEDKTDDNNELKGRRLQRRLDAVSWFAASQGVAPLSREKMLSMTRLDKEQLKQMIAAK